MSIQDNIQKINIIATIFGLTFLGIGLLTLALKPHTSESFTISTFDAPAFSENIQVQATKATVYASKNGKKYYYSDCSGLKRIKTENKVSFASAVIAEQAGYTKAANCH